MTAILTVEEASMSEPAILTIVCFVILSATLVISEKVESPAAWRRLPARSCRVV